MSDCVRDSSFFFVVSFVFLFSFFFFLSACLANEATYALTWKICGPTFLTVFTLIAQHLHKGSNANEREISRGRGKKKVAAFAM